MREPKPDWHDVPQALRARIESIVGEPIVHGETVWGGFGPTASFALTTVSGAKHFCKGTHPGNTKEGHAAVLRETENLTAFPELTRFGARLRGTANDDGWHLMVLEYVPRTQSVPPWTASAIAQVMRLVADFHRAMPPRAEVVLRDRWASDLIARAQNWHTLRDSPQRREGFIALFEDRAAAAAWLEASLQRFLEVKQRGAEIGGARGWAHMDIRSDNLVFGKSRVLLIDWPVLSWGPQLLDIAFFLPSLAGEGGPSCRDGLKLYEQAAGVTFDPEDIAIAVSIVSGFFAARAGEPDVPGLPRLRWIQKLQLMPALDWACQCLDLAPPPVPLPFRSC